MHIFVDFEDGRKWTIELYKDEDLGSHVLKSDAEHWESFTHKDIYEVLTAVADYKAELR